MKVNERIDNIEERIREIKREKRDATFLNNDILLALITAAIITCFIIIKAGVSEERGLEDNPICREVITKIEIDAGTAIEILDYPIESEILCEEGVVVKEYKNIGIKKIYTCLETNSGQCAGFGKTCLIKREVCE